MFEKFSKKLGLKATDGVVEGAKQSLNDRMDKYSDIIEIGLVVAVIAFGGNKLIGHSRRKSVVDEQQRYFNGNGTPIIINNYYQQKSFEPNPYCGAKGAKAAHGRKAEQNRQKR